jgi:hypothetical protein
MSKAKTLDLLSQHTDGFAIDPFLTFTVREWITDSYSIINRILNANIGPTVIVRSSAATEDTFTGQPPGTFESALDIPLNSPETLSNSIRRVIESYKRDSLVANNSEQNEVIVQRQLLKPLLSGVLATQDIISREPYYIIEYDDISGRTDTVTSGKLCKRIYIFRGATDVEWPWGAIVKVSRAIERILDNDQLFIEFAISQDRNVHVFQARQMRLPSGPPLFSESRVVATVTAAQAIIGKRRRAVWSDMTDWNPAEMLGERPRPLDISLYQFLVTDEIWTKARATLGYRNVSPRKLMQVFACKPFIDVEVSFLSLTPNELPSALARRLVRNRLEALRKHPELHDKVELEVLYTCTDVAKPPRTEALRAAKFSSSEVELIEGTLRSLTASILANADELISDDRANRKKLLLWHSSHKAPFPREPTSLLNQIHLGLTLCRDLGVLPFARLARLAFIGRDLVGRLIAGGALSQIWADAFWKSIDTVAADVAISVIELKSGRMSRNTFNERYGHLRPRTYDITSPRYDQIDFGSRTSQTKMSRLEPLSLAEHRDVLHSISGHLQQAGLPPDAHEFIKFVSTSFKEREQSKFDFTIVLSHCIEAIAQLGESLGFTRLELSYLTVKDIFKAINHRSSQRLRSQWSRRISEQQEKWETAEYVRQPSLIFSPADLIVIKPIASKPNFITSSKVEGHIVNLTSPIPSDNLRLGGSIVAIEAADPGYDWLFSHQIVALVTRFGGAASHMAVRCAEFGIPAAIGCGDELFRKIVASDRIQIDCGNKEITLLD